MLKISKNIRFYIYTIALIPFILLLATGVIMLKYHTGSPCETILLSFDGNYWRSFHKVLSVVTIPMILLHLLVKTDWIKCLFTLKVKGKFKKSNIMLFVVFTVCILSALGSWFIFNSLDLAGPLKGIHNKFGILLILIFGIHIWNYRKLILNQFKN